MHTEMSSSPAGVLRLPAGKHAGILTEFQTKVNKKIGQKWIFLGHEFYILNPHFYLRFAFSLNTAAL
jgi:hypothetical protein